MVFANRIRNSLTKWRDDGYPGVTRLTRQLIEWWRRDGRKTPLFFAQLEAAETIIFLREARQDYLRGIHVPIDQPSERQQAEGVKPFLRYACKMATGSGKTTVMGMLIAWSILTDLSGYA